MLCKIQKMDCLSEDVVRMVVQSEALRSIRPGQFVNVRCGDSLKAYLRRPISICDWHAQYDEADIVFQMRGEGTRLLAAMRPGEMADLMGPLGTPFQLAEKGQHIVVVGGGIGSFPLLYLLREMSGVHRTALLGFRNKDSVVLENEFQRFSENCTVSTDDGSYGLHGFVTAALAEQIQTAKPDMVYVCGPMPMMKAVVALCQKNGVRTQISMEQRMGCGVGACLVCACKKKSGDDYTYTHVCKEGPVFNGDDVVFD